jgi:hypothetical protein
MGFAISGLFEQSNLLTQYSCAITSRNTLLWGYVRCSGCSSLSTMDPEIVQRPKLAMTYMISEHANIESNF